MLLPETDDFDVEPEDDDPIESEPWSLDDEADDRYERWLDAE